MLGFYISRRIRKLEEELCRARNEKTNWEGSALEMRRGMEYYRDQLDLIAEHFGEDAYVCDDGSLSDTPLRAKMVDLVSDLVREKDAYRRGFVAATETLNKIFNRKVSKPQ